jgi:hypothetical protein
MSTTANSLASIAAEAASPDTLPSLSRDSTALANGEANGELGMDDGADLGGHGLLSRPALPQGRRSLFRR